MKSKYWFIYLIGVSLIGASGAAAFAQDQSNIAATALDDYELQDWGYGRGRETLNYDISVPEIHSSTQAQILAQKAPSDISDNSSFSEILADADLPENARNLLADLQQAEDASTIVEVSQNGKDQANPSPQAGLKDSFHEDQQASSLDTLRVDRLQLEEMDIVDVLKLISEKSGLNIISGQAVNGKVSIYLKDVKLKEALRIILDSNGLAYKEEEGIIHVMPAAEFESRYGYVFGGKVQTRVIHLMYARAKNIAPVLEQIKSNAGKIVIDDKSNTLIVMDSLEKVNMITDLIHEIDVPVEVEVFDLNYALAKDLEEKIEPFLTQGIGNIKYDERSNKIIVTDVADKMQKIKQIVTAFDVREQQVLIEAKIVQIELSDSYELGVDWQAIFTGLDDLKAQIDFDVIDSSESNSGVFSLGTIENNSYALMLEALEKAGDINILSSPSIMALNNQEAKILVGSTQPYVTSTTTTPSSGPTTTAETINFIEVGVSLYVTPTIHKDGYITMKIRPEVSSTLTPLTTSSGNEIPIVKTSEAETTVRIKDGVTIVIGGLIEDSSSEQRNKVPLLGDIPLVGVAFRNQNTSMTKTEIAIFLTPRIIAGDESIDTEFSSYSDVKYNL